MFYGLDQRNQKILQHAIGIISLLYKRVFHADHLITVERCVGFLDDPRFTAALAKAAKTAQHRSLAWRLHTLAWAGTHCLNFPGDFCECGVYKGFSSHFLVHYLDFASTDRTFYLYDTYEGIPTQHRADSPVRAGAYSEAGIYEGVLETFRPFPNVRVVKGVVPDVLAQDSPERIAYLHIDMNSASAEIAALEVLFDRVVPGGMIVLDDYGWQWYRAQKDAEDEFFGKRGHHVLELPTGQGLVVKRG